jgi:hypothetical protein
MTTEVLMGGCACLPIMKEVLARAFFKKLVVWNPPVLFVIGIDFMETWYLLAVIVGA